MGRRARKGKTTRRIAPGMRRLPAASLLLGLLLVLAVSGAGCRGDSPTAPGDHPLMADFTLTDVNPNSATNGDPVSPRQFLARISAWYFGHAT